MEIHASKLHSKSDKGQAMVEFLIILIFIMAMCAGMVSTIRLLGFQFWAQQEARFLAFEQTWVPNNSYSDSAGESIAKLGDGQKLGRPDLMSERDKTRAVEDAGSASQLLAFFKANSSSDVLGDKQPIENLDSSPVLLARNNSSLWTKKNFLYDVLGPKKQDFSFLETAYASQNSGSADLSEADSIFPDNQLQDRVFISDGPINNQQLERAFINILKKGGFGPKVCESLTSISVRNGGHQIIDRLRSGNCAQSFEKGFGHHLAGNVNFSEGYRSYEGFLEDGMSAGDAIQIVIRQEVANQYYSFFDVLVRNVRIGAAPVLGFQALDRASSFFGSNMDRILDDAQYAGSVIALGVLGGSAVSGGIALTTRDPNAILNLENTVNSIIHKDATFVGYLLSPITYFPANIVDVSSAFGVGLQEGVMKNVLFKDDDLKEEQIENSNKSVEVSYKAAGGLFPMATARIAGAEGAVLTARYYLITQPWHMERRKNRTGDYREKGTQFDFNDEDTEEALMRRRVEGLWLIPSNMGALVEPLALLPGLGFLQGPLDLLSAVSSLIGIVKGFITNNPLLKIASFLEDIPVIGSIVPVPPVWPAVRPDAYPGSEELTANDPDKKDEMAGEERDFQDYVDEQDHNPEPDPEFN